RAGRQDRELSRHAGSPEAAPRMGQRRQRGPDPDGRARPGADRDRQGRGRVPAVRRCGDGGGDEGGRGGEGRRGSSGCPAGRPGDHRGQAAGHHGGPGEGDRRPGKSGQVRAGLPPLALREDSEGEGACGGVSAPRWLLWPLLHRGADAAKSADPARGDHRRLRGVRRAALRSGMIPAKWALTAAPSAAAIHDLSAALTIPEPLAALLIQRGLGQPDLAKQFLRPELEPLSDPLEWTGMKRAVEIVSQAVRDRVPILVHGDYDVDGQCASSMLTRGLRAAGGNVHAFVPHRIRDGYDFGPAGLAKAASIGARLIITCDCGITAVETVARARAAGHQVIVTDHHLPGDALPDADAVLDPQQPGCPSVDKTLCGAGVAFKLVQALVPALGLSPNLPLHFLDFVALATVADVVPLTGENRILVRHGLKMLSDSRWTGLRALVEAAGLAGQPIRAGQVGFILAPRLNAAV